MLNSEWINESDLYGKLYVEKFDFYKDFKRSNRLFLKNVKYISDAKALGCKVSEGAMWVIDNFLSIQNRSLELFNCDYLKNKKFKSLEINNKYFPRVYVFCSYLFGNQKTIFQEQQFFKDLYEYEDKIRLSLNELWSVPFFLEYVILENIYNVVEKIRAIESQCYEGHILFNNIMKLINSGKFNLVSKKLENLLKKEVSLHTIEHFIDSFYENRIKDKTLEKFISKILNNENVNYHELKLKNAENLKQIRFKISMYIQSLKNISLFDWKIQLEAVSSVHREFLKDPSGIYPNMDYESREHYRRTLEKICKINNLNEYEESLNILKLSNKGESNYSRHIGYYLIDKGVERFKKIKKNIKIRKRNYFLSIFSLTLIGEALFIYFSKNIFENVYILTVISLVSLIIINDIVINFVNYLSSRNVSNNFVPKMDYSKKIPDYSKTMVVIPSLLTTQSDIDELVKNLELSYICNKNKNLYFSLLFDYVDSISYQDSDDKNLLDYVKTAILDLNNKYKDEFSKDKFYVFIRNKVYSESNKVYMGWERKRGKIMEFIKFLRGRESNYTDSITNYTELKDIKYLISIDSDTKLLKNSAYKLVGAIDHILNKAVIKTIKKRNKVIRGYGIVQPKVSISFKSSLNTIYSRLFCSNTETSSYSCMVSNIYQDVFSESIFMGKGIIDVDVFDKILWDVIPENRILSHDLIEGCFTKVALSSDIEIQESFPSNILSSFMRLHRWIRGDLQLISYLFNGKGINLLSKYKILDNIRKVLLPISYFVLFFVPIFLDINRRDMYYGIITLSFIVPFILELSSLNFVKTSRDKLLFSISGLFDKLIQSFIVFAFLPYHVYITLDAIVKVIVRLLFTKQNLLEWKSFSEVEKSLKDSIMNYLKTMFPCFLVGLAGIPLSLYFDVYEVIVPSIIFIISPFMAYKLSEKYRIKKESIRGNQNIYLRALSRSIFAYFEDFVTKDTNYLVCDNYQEEPSIGIAKKTSPTNIGMSLSSFVLARDFGFITVLDMIDRLEKILNSIDILPIYRGHLYNWYDIEKNIPLGNKYVSTVDSGNLLASYYLCRKSLEDILDKPIIHKDVIKSFEELCYLSNKSSMDHLYKDLIKKGFMCVNYLDYIEFLEKMIDESKKNINELSKDGEDVYWHIKINEMSTNFLNEILNITCSIHEINNSKINKFLELFTNTSIKNLEKEILESKNNYNNSVVRNEIVDNKISKILDNVRKLKGDIYGLIDRITYKISSMDFKFLYNDRKNLLSIGYDCENDILDENCYDLLASEVRIASFLSIAKGDVPFSHWFKLSRIGFKENGIKTLLSWSGTAFEYLMPMLYMKAYPRTLFFDTYKGCVDAQIRYSNSHKIPFGISESCFYELDNDLNYQYKAFGVPDLAIKKDHENLVVSPYSSIMSLMVDFKNSLKNLNLLEKLGSLGKYGFYEAIDFTKSRISRDNEYCIVRSYMAHHQGMSFMSLANILIEDVCQERFEKIVDIESISELLNESSLNISIEKISEDDFVKDNDSLLEDEFIPRIVRYQKDKLCDMQIYSNGQYSLCLSSSGGGYLKFNDEYISNPSNDFVNEKSWGSIYIKDLDDNELFSNTYLPCKNDDVDYICEFSFNKAKFISKSKKLNVTSEIIVSKDDDVEIRKVIIRNLTSKPRDIELTSYFESDILNQNVDFIRDENLIVCGNGSLDLFVGHSIYFDNKQKIDVDFEVRKESFIGRNGTLQYPISMESGSRYGSYVVDDSDNIMSLRSVIKLNSYSHASIYFINSISTSKESLLNVVDKYRNIDMINGLFKNSIYNLKSMIHNLRISSNELSLFNYMTSRIIYGASDNRYSFNSKFNIKDLISHNINPNIPIVSIEVNSTKDLTNVETLVKAFSYFSINRLEFNLVILNSYTRYDKKIENEIDRIILEYNLKDKINVDNGIYIILSNLYKNAYDIIKNISNLHIVPGDKSVYDQLGFVTKDLQEVLNEERSNNLISPYDFRESRLNKRILFNKYLFEISDEITNYGHINKYDMPKKMLKFYNSYGGFDKKYLEYVLKLNNSNITPNYYRNVLKNKYIATMISSKGFVSTWAYECKEFLITEELDRNNYNYKGECIYIREDNSIWSPTLNPIGNGEDYIVSNSFNYTTIKNTYKNVRTKIKYFIPKDKKYKLVKINFRNLSSEDRKLGFCYFAPLSLSSHKDYSKKLSTYINFELGYIYGENNFSRDFSNLKAYLKVFGCENISFAGSKREFLGINKGYFDPVGMNKEKLSDLCGIFSEACLCILGDVKLSANEEKDVYVLLGYDDNIENINLEIEKFINNPELFDILENENKVELDNKYKDFQIKTQDEYLDLFINGWILHQSDNEKFLLNSSSKGELNSCIELMDKCLIYNYINPEESKKNIIKVFSNIYENGSFKDKWSYLTKEYEVNDDLYDLLWMVSIVIDYINVTKDFDLLSLDISYANNNDKKNHYLDSSNIYDKCVLIIKKCIMSNYTLNRNVLEETKVLFILYKCIDGFRNISLEMNDNSFIKTIDKVKVEIIEFLSKECFNGEFYINKISDKENDNYYNDIYLLPQVLSLGVVENTRESVLSSIDKYLINKDIGFIREYFRKNTNILSEFKSTQNNREVLLFIKELLNLGLNDIAYRYLEFLNPVLKTMNRNDVNIYKSESYIIPYKIIFSGNTLFKVVNEDFKYVSALFYRIILEDILGICINNEGLMLKPNIPSFWNGYVAEYRRNGILNKIIVRRGENPHIKINGEKHVENNIKFMDNEQKIIDLTI